MKTREGVPDLCVNCCVSSWLSWVFCLAGHLLWCLPWYSWFSVFFVLCVVTHADVWGLWNFSVHSTLLGSGAQTLAAGSLGGITDNLQVIPNWASHPHLPAAENPLEFPLVPLPPNPLQGIPTSPTCGVLLHSCMIFFFFENWPIYELCFFLLAHGKLEISITLVSNLREISLIIFVFFQHIMPISHFQPGWHIIIYVPHLRHQKDTPGCVEGKEKPVLRFLNLSGCF